MPAGGLTHTSRDDSLRAKKPFFLSGANGQMDSHRVTHRAWGPNACADGEKNEIPCRRCLPHQNEGPAPCVGRTWQTLEFPEPPKPLQQRRPGDSAWWWLPPGPWPPFKVETIRNLERNSAWKKLEGRLLSARVSLTQDLNITQRGAGVGMAASGVSGAQ